MQELSVKIQIPKIKILQLDPKDNKVNYFLGREFTMGDPESDLPLTLAKKDRIKVQVLSHETFKLTSEHNLNQIEIGPPTVTPLGEGTGNTGNVSKEPPKEHPSKKVAQAEIAFGARFTLQSIPMMLEYHTVAEEELPLSLQHLAEFELEKSYGFSKHRLLKMMNQDLTPRQQVLAAKIAEWVRLEEILDPYVSAETKDFRAPPLRIKVLRGSEMGLERIIENPIFTIGREGDDIPLRHADFEVAHFLVEILPANRLLVKKLNPKSAGKIDGHEFEYVVIDENSQLTVGDTCLGFTFKITDEAEPEVEQFGDPNQFGEESVIQLDMPLDEYKKIKIKGPS